MTQVPGRCGSSLRPGRIARPMLRPHEEIRQRWLRATGRQPATGRRATPAAMFVPRGEWNSGPTGLAFTTKGEVAHLFRGWEIIELTEIEEDGTTATGGKKHWDVIHVIARKRRRPVAMTGLRLFA